MSMMVKETGRESVRSKHKLIKYPRTKMIPESSQILSTTKLKELLKLVMIKSLQHLKKDCSGKVRNKFWRKRGKEKKWVIFNLLPKWISFLKNRRKNKRLKKSFNKKNRKKNKYVKRVGKLSLKYQSRQNSSPNPNLNPNQNKIKREKKKSQIAIYFNLMKKKSQKRQVMKMQIKQLTIFSTTWPKGLNPSKALFLPLFKSKM